MSQSVTPQARRNTFRPLLALIFLVVGLALCVSGGVSAVRTRALLQNGIRTIGEIESAPRGRGGYMMVSFYDQYRHRFSMPASGEKGVLFQPGQQIGIIYNKDDPKDAVVDTFTNLWIIALVCSVFGLGCVTLAIKTLTTFARGHRGV